MSPEREWSFRIQHIVDAIRKIMRYTAGMSFEEFTDDDRAVDPSLYVFVDVAAGDASYVPSSSGPRGRAGR